MEEQVAEYAAYVRDLDQVTEGLGRTISMLPRCTLSRTEWDSAPGVLEELMARNAEISLEMERLSALYDSVTKGEEIECIDEQLDALAEECDEIEHFLQERKGVPGGGRVYIHPKVSEASVLGSHAAENVYARPDGQTLDGETEEEMEIHDVNPRSKRPRDDWEEKFEKAYENRSSETKFWSAPILQRLNEYYEQQLSDYQVAPKKTKTIKRAVEQNSGMENSKVLKVLESDVIVLDENVVAHDHEFDAGSLHVLIEILMDAVEDLKIIESIRYLFEEGLEFPIEFEEDHYNNILAVLVTSEIEQLDLDCIALVISQSCVAAKVQDLVSLDSLGVFGINCSGSIPSVDVEDIQVRVTLAIDVEVKYSSLLFGDHLRRFDLKVRSRINRLLSDLDDGREDEEARLNIEDSFEIEKLYSSLKKLEWTDECGEVPSMSSTLSSYQKRAVSWMLSRERNPDSLQVENASWRSYSLGGREISFNVFTGQFAHGKCTDAFNVAGGILADEMGLGKSIEMLALILSHPDESFEGRYCVVSDRQEYILEPVYKSKATLIISPSNIVHQWQNEIRKHANSLTVLVYEGFNNVPFSLNDCAEADIVITSYDVLKQEVNFSKPLEYQLRFSKKYRNPESFLIGIHWRRVIMDEAQMIENSTAQTAEMANRLSCTYRWCVTGTPIGKGGLDDLYGLFFFLQHPLLSERKLWKEVSSYHLVSSNDTSYLVKFLYPFFWRLTKADVSEEVELPPLAVKQLRLQFTPVEEEYYKKAVLEILSCSDMGSQAEKWHQIESLRKACSHPEFLRPKKKKKAKEHKTQSPWAGRAKPNKKMIPLEPQESTRGLEVLSKELHDQALSEIIVAEKELCSRLNSLALGYIATDRPDEAERVLIEAWWIGDVGFDYHDHRDLAKGKLIPTKRDLKVPNTFLPTWLKTLRITLLELSKLLQRKLSAEETSEEEKDLASFNLHVLNAELKLNQRDILDATMRKANAQIIKIWLWYFSVLPNFMSRALDRVADLYDKWLDISYHYIFEDHFGSRVFDKHVLDLEWEQIVNFCKTWKSRVRFPERLAEILEAAQKLKVHIGQDPRRKGLMMEFQLADLYLGIASYKQVMQRLNGPFGSLQYQITRSILQRNLKEYFQRVVLAELQEKRSAYPQFSEASKKSKKESKLSNPGTRSLERMKHDVKVMTQNLERGARRLEKKCSGRYEEFLEMRKNGDIDGLREAYEEAREAYNFIVDNSAMCLQFAEVNKDETIMDEVVELVEKTEEEMTRPQENVIQDALETLQMRVASSRRNTERKVRHARYLRRKFALLNDEIANSKNVSEFMCNICQDVALSPVLSSCAHLYCQSCMSQWSSKKRCPICREEMDLFPVRDLRLGFQHDFSYLDQGLELVRMVGQYGVKIEAVIKMILRYENDKSIAKHLKPKTLVFSQFPEMLTMLSQGLKENGIYHEMLKDGPSKRRKSLSRFTGDSGVRVLLMNMRSDASGLTLINANQVILLEPSLDPAVEDQAINRVHRRGQTNAVQVWKMVVQGSIEERVQFINESRRSLRTSSLTTKKSESLDLTDTELVMLLSDS